MTKAIKKVSRPVRVVSRFHQLVINELIKIYGGNTAITEVINKRLGGKLPKLSRHNIVNWRNRGSVPFPFSHNLSIVLSVPAAALSPDYDKLVDSKPKSPADLLREIKAFDPRRRKELLRQLDASE